jgi:ribosomal protein S18 acetylase RimI-like enzyme
MSTHDISIRNAVPEDHQRIISAIPDWWGGRDLRSSVPKLFLIHFGTTSFVAETNRRLAGFLVGFMSQTRPHEGYIHFVGVDPDFRKKGLARTLYHKFYDACRQHSRHIVRSCTAPVNRLSIAFHEKMGFEIEPGDRMVDGVPITEGYLQQNDLKVLFRKDLSIR